MQIRDNYPLDSKSFGLRRFRHENGTAGVDFDEFLPPKRFLGSTWTKKQSCSSVQGLSTSENFLVLSLKLFKIFDFKQLSLKSPSSISESIFANFYRGNASSDRLGLKI